MILELTQADGTQQATPDVEGQPAQQGVASLKNRAAKNRAAAPVSGKMAGIEWVQAACGRVPSRNYRCVPKAGLRRNLNPAALEFVRNPGVLIIGTFSKPAARPAALGSVTAANAGRKAH